MLLSKRQSNQGCVMRPKLSHSHFFMIIFSWEDLYRGLALTQALGFLGFVPPRCGHFPDSHRRRRAVQHRPRSDAMPQANSHATAFEHLVEVNQARPRYPWRVPYIPCRARPMVALVISLWHQSDRLNLLRHHVRVLDLDPDHGEAEFAYLLMDWCDRTLPIKAHRHYQHQYLHSRQYRFCCNRP